MQDYTAREIHQFADNGIANMQLVHPKIYEVAASWAQLLAETYHYDDEAEQVLIVGGIALPYLMAGVTWAERYMRGDMNAPNLIENLSQGSQ
jgi:hypothetical protein